MARIVETLDPTQIIVSFKMPRAFGIRMWATTMLLRLVDLVAPVTIEIEVTDAP